MGSKFFPLGVVQGVGIPWQKIWYGSWGQISKLGKIRVGVQWNSLNFLLRGSGHTKIANVKQLWLILNGFGFADLLTLVSCSWTLFSDLKNISNRCNDFTTWQPWPPDIHDHPIKQIKFMYFSKPYHPNTPGHPSSLPTKFHLMIFSLAAGRC